MFNPLDMTVRDFIRVLREMNAELMVLNDGAHPNGIHCTWCMVMATGDGAEGLLAHARELEEVQAAAASPEVL